MRREQVTKSKCIHPEMLHKIEALKSFAKFIGKTHGGKSALSKFYFTSEKSDLVWGLCLSL